MTRDSEVEMELLELQGQYYGHSWGGIHQGSGRKLSAVGFDPGENVAALIDGADLQADLQRVQQKSYAALPARHLSGIR